MPPCRGTIRHPSLPPVLAPFSRLWISVCRLSSALLPPTQLEIPSKVLARSLADNMQLCMAGLCFSERAEILYF